MERKNILKFITEVVPVAFLFLSLLFFGITGVYSGIESGDLTLATVSMWIWENGTLFYWFIAAITAGHCLALCVVDENNSGKKRTSSEKTDVLSSILFASAASGALWPAYWSFITFYPLYKKIADQKKK